MHSLAVDDCRGVRHCVEALENLFHSSFFLFLFFYYILNSSSQKLHLQKCFGYPLHIQNQSKYGNNESAFTRKTTSLCKFIFPFLQYMSKQNKQKPSSCLWGVLKPENGRLSVMIILKNSSTGCVRVFTCVVCMVTDSSLIPSLTNQWSLIDAFCFSSSLFCDTRGQTEWLDSSW